jgi:hypothetical protein
MSGGRSGREVVKEERVSGRVPDDEGQGRHVLGTMGFFSLQMSRVYIHELT